MRVLILTNLYPNPWQPHRAAFNRQQFAALAKTHETRVIAPVAWTQKLHQPTVLRDNMIVEHPTFVFPPKMLRSWHGHFYERSVQPVFDRIVNRFAPDVVLASWAYPDAWAAVRLAGRAGLPVVTKVHGSDVLMLERHPQKRRATVEALCRSDAVVAVSRHLAAAVRSLGAGCHIVHNGVNTKLFHPDTSQQKREPIILFVGNLVPVKGIDTLIDACAQLARRGATFQCQIIGDGPMREKLARQITRLRLDGNVELIGALSMENLPERYRAASVLALPSFSEGIPNVILEAQACGTPVVASAVGGVPEVLGKQGLVPPGDAQALADALERTLSQPFTTTNASARSWEASAAELAGVLEEAVARRRKVAA
jgi:glycosyltransferase involved in cell wall biosynthesis